ncbi:MAG: DUF6134 family protein [Deltaproteobacteria bacterium]
MTGIRLQTGCKSILQMAAALLGMAAATVGAAEPQELERETREFKVSVDGKGRGKCTIEISRREDGSDRMDVNAALSFNYVVYEYRYSSVGTEVWKNGRLVRLDNTADYNGTKYVVKAKADQKGLRVTVNDTTSQMEPDVWVTSYWRLPDRLAEADTAAGRRVVPTGGRRPVRKGVTATIALLDSDKGQKLKGEVRRIGEETITVAGKKQTSTHFKISGDVKVDVWYDADQRLVRQETVESGHKTVMELTRIAVE